MNKFSFNKALAIGAFVSFLFGASSFATVTFDLRAVSKRNGIAGTPVAIGTPKAVVVAIDDYVTFDLVVQVTGLLGGAGQDEGFQQFLAGSILSSGSGGTGTTGFIGTFINTGAGLGPQGAWAGVNGSAQGTVVDLDSGADAIVDIGNNGTTYSGVQSSTGGVGGPFIGANAAGMQLGSISGVSEFLVNRVELRIQNLVNPIPPSMFVNFRITNTAGLGNDVVWREDGVTKTSSAASNAQGVFVGSQVVITAVPEPSAFGMVLIGALGLVGFRRLGLRRQA